MIDHFLLEPAHRVLNVCLNLQPSETLLVLTDSTSTRYGAAFAAAGHIIGAEVVEMTMTPRTRHGEEPRPPWPPRWRRPMPSSHPRNSR